MAEPVAVCGQHSKLNCQRRKKSPSHAELPELKVLTSHHKHVMAYLTCRFAHSMGEPLSVVPILTRIVANVSAGLTSDESPQSIAFAPINVGTNWKAQAWLILVNLSSSFIGSPIHLATVPPLYDGAPRSSLLCSRPGSVF
jgi:hypothetical protein